MMGSVRKDLKTLTVGGVTSAQVTSAGARIYLSNVPDLEEAGQLGRDIQAIRSFGPWLDPNGGAQDVTGDATSATLRPSAGEQYVVYGAQATNSTGGSLGCILNLTDGATVTQIVTTSAPGSGAVTAIVFPYPLVITNTLYLVASNTGNLAVNFAYHTSVRA